MRAWHSVPFHFNNNSHGRNNERGGENVGKEFVVSSGNTSKTEAPTSLGPVVLNMKKQNGATD